MDIFLFRRNVHIKRIPFDVKGRTQISNRRLVFLILSEEFADDAQHHHFCLYKKDGQGASQLLIT